MDFDTDLFANERHARLQREAQEERLAASLPQRPWRNPLVLAQQILARSRAASTGPGTLRPTQRAWQSGKE